jgi:hypothetical protein
MFDLNFSAAWIGFLLGCISGMLSGMFFHKKEWMGGYDSWERRMTRLGHISFFGIGFINLFFALSCDYLDLSKNPMIPSILLIIAAIMMPLTCYLSAWKKPLRALFPIPALSATVAIALFIPYLFK